MMRLGWKAGRAADHQGPFFVSATRFTYRQHWHMPSVFWHGLRLRAGWGGVSGAVGLSIMADLSTCTTYTLSLWRTPADLQQWVRSPGHAVLMRAYGRRLESSAVTGWHTGSFDLGAAWREALPKLKVSATVD